MDKSIIFMGTPEFAAHILERLISEGFNIVCVVTQPDKPFGRKKILKQSEVKEVALKHNIEVFQPIKIREDYTGASWVNVGGAGVNYPAITKNKNGFTI